MDDNNNTGNIVDLNCSCDIHYILSLNREQRIIWQDRIYRWARSLPPNSVAKIKCWEALMRVIVIRLFLDEI
jgi:hypothetical protein